MGSSQLVNGSKKRLARFGVFELDLDAGELRKQGLRLQLQPKPLQMLAILLERPGEIVTREELRRRLWDDDTFVDYESGLNTAANRLRLKLGDSADTPRYVETMARSGYRFIAPVERIDWEPPAPVSKQPEPRNFAPRWYLAAAAIAIALAAVVYFATRTNAPAQARFRQLTFRRGQVLGARFTPNGQDILYAAQWDQDPRRLFLTSRMSPESRALGFEDKSLVSISKTGELALLSSSGTMNIAGGKLFRAPMNGSDPSFVDQGIMTAEWSRDGAKLALVRAAKGRNQIEYPAGNIIYSTSGWVSNLRFSPVSEALAFVEHPVRHDDAGHVRLIAAGATSLLGGDWVNISGLAWHPSGKEIWFTSSRDEGPRGVWAVSPSGKLRSVASAPGVLTLRDIAPDGRVLISRDVRRLEIAGKLAGDVAERDLSWLDWSRVQEISSDGGLILFDESGEAAGGHSLAYVRKTASGAVTRLGEGTAGALSPDGKSALLIAEDRLRLRLVAVDGGTPKTLPDTGLSYQWVKYFPDGRRLLALGSLPKQGLRLYVQSLDDSKLAPISPEMMVRNAAISPDGGRVAILSADNRLLVYPASGGDPHQIPAAEPLAPLRWSKDGEWIFVQRLSRYTELPARVFRVRARSGEIKPWNDISPADPMGVNSVTGVSIGPDERFYVYSYRRVLSELYLVEGWL
jgi:DNA-binding winged helix-turn-helix (wHTH) protein/WD40 repeat protein